MTLIAHMTDFHLRPSGLTCYRVSDTNMLAERAIRSLLALEQQPDAVIITGDLTDRGDPREYAIARTLFSKLPMPVYLIPGNHDTSASMRAAFPDHPGIEDCVGEKFCFTADIGACRLIALDSHVSGCHHGEIGAAQLEWLSHTLEQEKRPSLIAIHHPPAKTGIPHMDDIGLKDAADLAKVIAGHDHIERILCGHVHRPITASFAGKIMSLAPSVAHQLVLDLTQNARPLFNFEPPAYYLHYYTPASGVVTHTAYVESFPGPYPFWADEGVAWPGDETP